MQCRQTRVGWLRNFILLIMTLGMILTLQAPALALMPSRQSPQTADVVEVSPPEAIQKLRVKIDQYTPQVKILSPAADQLIKDDTVSVRFEVRDLPIFKDEKLGLGPHLSVFLDNQPSQEVYDLSQPLVFKELAPGTHTIRVVANRPWFESFKNPSAYAQTTFHVFTRTEENIPSPNQPLLTYGQPQGVWGTDTVFLDFYLSNLPKTVSNKGIKANWRVLVSINGSSFYIDDWHPLYIQGLKPGKNWVRFELTDRRGQKIGNAFNDTIRVIEVREKGDSTLAKLVRGDLSAIDAGGIVDPHYKRPQPSPTQSPAPQLGPASISTPEPKATPAQSPQLKAPKPTPLPAPASKQPKPAPAPKPASPKPSEVEPPTATPSQVEDGKPKGVDKRSAGDSAKTPAPKTPAPSKTDEKQTLKTQKGQPSSSALKSEPSQLKQEPAKELPTVPTKPKPFEEKPLQPSSKTEQDSKPKPKTRKESFSPQPKSENLPPKAADQPVPKPSAAKSTPPKREAPSLLPAPIKSKSTDENVSPVPTISEDDKPSMVPSSSDKSKVLKQDKSSSLKARFTKIWDQIRPSQTQSKSSIPAPLTLEKKESIKGVEPQTTPIPSSTPATKVPAITTPTPTKPSLSKAAKQPAPATSIPQSSPPTIPERPKSSTFTPTPDQTQSNQGRDSLVKEGAEKTPSPSIPPTVKSEQSRPSVFPSWRDRWQRQKQKTSSPTQQRSTSANTPPSKTITKPSTVKSAPAQGGGQETTPAKIAPSKATHKSSPVNQTPSSSIEKKDESQPSVSPDLKDKSTQPSPSAFSSLRDRWQRQKQLMSPPTQQETPPVSPKSTEKAPEKPAPNNTMQQKPGKKEVGSGANVTQSQPDIENSKPVTFDPGVFYRRFLSKKEASSPQTEASSTPSLEN